MTPDALPLRLNPALDLGRYAEIYARRGLVQIPDVFEPAVAATLERMLAGPLPWRLLMTDAADNPIHFSQSEAQALGREKLDALAKDALLRARQHWSDKPLWLTETSGPPKGWRQSEWFWWMMAEVNLARLLGVDIPVFTWAPVISMFDWVHETRPIRNGVWKLTPEGDRIPNDYMLLALQLAREYGYIR